MNHQQGFRGRECTSSNCVSLFSRSFFFRLEGIGKRRSKSLLVPRRSRAAGTAAVAVPAGAGIGRHSSAQLNLPDRHEPDVWFRFRFGSSGVKVRELNLVYLNLSLLLFLKAGGSR